MFCEALPVSSDPRVVAAEQLLDRLTQSDPDLHDHAYATGILAAQILGVMGKPNDTCASAFIVGILHDVGLASIGEYEQPRLASEWLWLQRRVRRVTYQLIRSIPALREFAAAAAGVHSEIARTFVTKAVCVADQYDVLTRAWGANPPHCTPFEALTVLRRSTGWKYDARVVAAFERIFEEVAA